jgi:hypothetical protein
MKKIQKTLNNTRDKIYAYQQGDKIYEYRRTLR